MQRIVGSIAELIAAVIISFLFGQVAARLVPTTDQLFFTICTVGAYVLGVMVGVYVMSEFLDLRGNFWFLLTAAVFGGVVVFAAYSFESVNSASFWDALVDYVTSLAMIGPVLAVFAFNIGPKDYRIG